MAWKWRIYVTCLSLVAAFVGAALVSRRFHAEVARLTSEYRLQNDLIAEMLDSVKAGLNHA
jgi:hypothetical protein